MGDETIELSEQLVALLEKAHISEEELDEIRKSVELGNSKASEKIRWLLDRLSMYDIDLLTREDVA